jgi:hypothetical protein
MIRSARTNPPWRSLAALAFVAPVLAVLGSAAGADEARHTLTASGTHYELVVKNDPIAPGADAALDVFVSDFATNAPVGGAEVGLEVRGDAGAAWSGTATPLDAERPGIYRAAFRAPAEAGEYRIVARVRANGVEERFAIAGLDVGASGAPGEPARGGARGARSVALPIALAAVFVALAAAFLGMRARRRGRGAGRTALGLALAAGSAIALASADALHAHEGHKEPPALVGAAVAPGAIVSLGKESQFLLGVRTEPARSELSRRQLDVIGRVAPRGGVELELTAPQAGRLAFRPGRAPVIGRRYRRGEEIGRLAVVDELVLRAPQAGVVTGVFAVSGQLVQPGQKLVALVDPSVVWVHADVFEADLARVQNAKEAVIASDAAPGLALSGKLIAIGAAQGEVPGTVETWFEVPNPGERLKIGSLVDVGIEESRADSSIALPREAIFEKDGRKLVFVHVAPERFEAREVALLDRVGPRVSVRRGVVAGERVVVAGGYSLLSAPVIGAAR